MQNNSCVDSNFYNTTTPGGCSDVQSAVVVGHVGGSRYCVIIEGSDKECRAELAMQVQPQLGERVLITRSLQQDYYLTAIISPTVEENNYTSFVLARNGAKAVCLQAHETEHLQILDADGALIFDYDSKSKRAVLGVPKGDLVFQAKGNIDFVSGEKLRMLGAGGLTLSSPCETTLSCSAGDTTPVTQIKLKPDTMQLASSSVNLKAARSRIMSREMHLLGGRVFSHFDSVHVSAKRLVCNYDRIIEHAKNVYRKVEDVHRLVAGRVRILSKGTVDYVAGRVNIKGAAGVKIDGDKIHLG